MTLKKYSPTGSRNLVYTSAGDSANVQNWLTKNRDFDLWVTYYGDEEDSHLDLCDIYNMQKGGKYPNLKKCVTEYRNHFLKYDHVLVLDDDILFRQGDINTLFDIAKDENFDLCQPSLSLDGKVSHLVTLTRPFSYLRYVDFVEMNAPLFKLKALLHYLDTSYIELKGFGDDVLFCHALKESAQNRKIGMIDYISCINPHDDVKGDGREINKVSKETDGTEYWKQQAQERGLPYSKGIVRTFGKKRSFSRPIRSITQLIKYLKHYKTIRWLYKYREY